MKVNGWMLGAGTALTLLFGVGIGAAIESTHSPDAELAACRVAIDYADEALGHAEVASGASARAIGALADDDLYELMDATTDLREQVQPMTNAMTAYEAAKEGCER